MRFTLEYPITRVYPWRCFTLATFALSTVVLTVLTVINVATVGYENVTVLRADFNASETLWWSKFQISPKSPCDPHTFLPGDAFTSNLTIMDYTVRTINVVPQLTNSTPVVVYTDRPGLFGLQYAANLLAAPCNFTDQGTVDVQVNRQQKYVQGSISFSCQFPSEYIMTVDALYTSYSFFSPLPVDEGFLANDTRAAPIVQRTIDKLATDLLVSVIVGFNESSGVKLDGITASGFPVCPAFASAGSSQWTDPAQLVAECNTEPLNLNLLQTDAAFSNDTFADINGTMPDAMRIALRNYMYAFSAAALGDIGIWNANNIFLSADMINKTIDANDALTAVLGADPSLGAWYSWDTNTTSAASQLRAWQSNSVSDQTFVVPLPEEGRTAAVIALSYLCHDPRLKSPLNFIISVVVADASVFGVFWGLFLCFASMIARRSRSSANTCRGHDIESPAEGADHKWHPPENEAYQPVAAQELV